ncbi:hypothetical protein AAFF_G00290210 [Aldrovandia affinis]|uniref:Uncharacterized protein n=1 Tax=Aldrovandia affinis TaxID=143900 RepID=A0AAD7R9L8_9TELE|nr:hypothetical protein AAFF_G00290210 [Aldrovandia affinis]
MGNSLPKMTAAPNSIRPLSFVQNLHSRQADSGHNHNNSNNNEVTEDPCTQQENKAPGGSSTQNSKAPVENVSQVKESREASSHSKGTLAVVQQEWKLEVLSTTTRSDGVQSRRMKFEKWVTVEQESQRTLAKRQLSAESSAQSFRVVKKGTVRKQEGELTVIPSAMQSRPKPQAGPRRGLNPPAAPRRKLRKELFPSAEVFQAVDARTITTGKQLRDQQVFSAQILAQAITRGALSDLERLRAIWIWLCHNIEYDVSGYLGPVGEAVFP